MNSGASWSWWFRRRAIFGGEHETDARGDRWIGALRRFRGGPDAALSGSFRHGERPEDPLPGLGRRESASVYHAARDRAYRAFLRPYRADVRGPVSRDRDGYARAWRFGMVAGGRVSGGVLRQGRGRAGGSAQPDGPDVA